MLREMDSSYADSVGSSPRSVGTGRGTDSEYPASQRWEDATSSKVRLMCSYGGRILPRPHDNQLCYLGGDSRIVVVNRNITYSDLIAKLSRTYGSNVCVKYQLPNEDLDALISVTTDEDLENMMEEYDRYQQSSLKPFRLRVFLFPTKLENTSSLGSLLDSSKRERWFVDALNGAPILSRGMSEGSSVVSDQIPDYLFGLESVDYWDRSDDKSTNNKPISSGVQNLQGGQPVGKTRMLNAQPEGISGNPPPDVHSAPDSPMLETSSYGSTSSAPPGSNLPPLKVKPGQILEDEPVEVQQQRGNVENSYRKFDASQNLSVEGQEQKLGYEDIGRTIGYRGNNQLMMNAPDDHGLDIHNGDGNMLRGPQDIGLRTQDPRLNFDEHITKIKYQKPEPYVDQIPFKDGKMPVSSSSEALGNKPRPSAPEISEKMIPVQDFEQLKIFTMQQQQQEKQTRQEYTVQEEVLEARYDWNAKPVSKSPEISLEGINQPAVKEEGSQPNLLPVNGINRDGSQSNLAGFVESDQRNPNRQQQDEINLVNMATVQMRQSDRSKYQDTVAVNPANPQKDRSKPNLDRRAEEMEVGVETSYMQKDQRVLVQPAQQDHNYVPLQFEQQYVPSHFIHQGQPMSYYQVHPDPQLQQGDQPYPIYLVPAASPMLQTMGTVIRGQSGYGNVPLQRNMGVTLANAPTGYSADVLSAKPVTTTVQATAPPIQRQAHDPIPKVVNATGAPYRDQQFPTQPNMAPAPPRNRAPRPGQSDTRMMYRPAQAANPAPLMHPDQQYGYQHVQVAQNLTYETNPPQVYYTQNASIVNPPYQGQGPGPLNPDHHSST